jgi:hypothetical protein
MPLVRTNIALVIDEIDDPLSLVTALAVGHPITGQFQYDTHVAASDPGRYDLTDSADSFISLDAGHGITWATAAGGSILTADVLHGAGDAVSFKVIDGDFSVSVRMDVTHPHSQENPKCAFHLDFGDPTGRALSNDHLPVHFPSLAAWTASGEPYAGGRIEIDNSNTLPQGYRVLAHVTALSPA